MREYFARVKWHLRSKGGQWGLDFNNKYNYRFLLQERQETKTFSFKYSRVYFTTHRSFYHDLRITFGRWAPISFEMAQCLRIMNRIHVTGILKRLNA